MNNQNSGLPPWWGRGQNTPDFNQQNELSIEDQRKVVDARATHLNEADKDLYASLNRSQVQVWEAELEKHIRNHDEEYSKLFVKHKGEQEGFNMIPMTPKQREDRAHSKAAYELEQKEEHALNQLMERFVIEREQFVDACENSYQTSNQNSNTDGNKKGNSR